MTKPNTLITADRLRAWGADREDYRWFLDRYIYGNGDFAYVYDDLLQEPLYLTAAWLMTQVFSETRHARHLVAVTASVTDFAQSVVPGVGAATNTATVKEQAHVTTVARYTAAITAGECAHATAAGHAAHAATSGFGACATTAGEQAHAITAGLWAHATTTNNRACAATVGYQSYATTAGPQAHAFAAGECARAATEGSSAHAATAGFGATVATGGRCAHALAAGPESHASTSGCGAIAAAFGRKSRAKARLGGAIVLAHRNEYGELLGVKAAMVGEQGIEPGIWYTLDADGNFQRVDD